MEPAPIPDGDGERTAGHRIVEAPADEQLDRITAAAAQFFGVPIGVISLIDRGRVVVKSTVGLDAELAGCDAAFSAGAILADQPFVVADTGTDPRFADNPFVTGPPKIGFYAGYPIQGPSGHRIGALCVMGDEPRSPSNAELEMLRVLAEAAQNRIAEITRTHWLGSPAELLIAATNAAGIGLWEWDLRTNLLAWDDKMYALYGIGAAEFTGAYEAWTAGLHPDDRAGAELAGRRAISGEADYDTQFRVVWPTGDIRWIQAKATITRDESGEPLSMLGLNWDITAEKAVEAQLARAAAREATTEFMGHVEAAIADLPLVLYGTGFSEGAHNDRWLLGDSLRLVGLSRASLEAGADILSNVVPGDRDHEAQQQAGAPAGGIASISEQFRIRGHDGTEKWVQHVAKLDSQARTETGALLDIDIAKRLSLKLNESEKMEALGRLAGGVAQDFNNILAAISNFALLARDAANADAEIRADLGEIIAATERAESLTRQLLTVYRPSAGLHLTDLNQRVVALTPFLSTALGAAVEVNVQPSVGPAVVLIDPTELDRVIINLALNARDAMPAGGRFDVVVSRSSGPPDGPTSVARLTVSDTGVGMAPETARRVFEPFYTTKEFGPSTGLGLFSCFGIITDAGGTIAVTSVEGAGTTFTVDLPLLETDLPLLDADGGDLFAGSAGQAPADTERMEPSTQRRADARSSILLVEGDPAVRTSTQRLLEGEGFAVTAVGRVAVAREAVLALDFDLVISDVRLPDGNGMDFVREVKDRQANLPVLLWTGQPTIDAATRAVREGVAGFLIKPVPAADLIRAAHDAIGQGRHLRWRNKLMASHIGGNEFLSELSGVEGALTGLARVEEAFDAALATLRVHFQPIVDAGDSSVFGYEALLRCDGPLFVSPPRFIGAAELLGRVNDVGVAVRRAVADVVSARPVQAHTIFVNLHPSEVRADLLSIATEPLLPFASQVVLEITERTALDHDRGLEDDLARLRECGYRIAIDDLGEGYAGLSNLVRVNPDICKIDMSLVRNIDRTPLKQDIVSAIVGMARPHRILVVAEGVETVAERATLRDLGCDLLQGYLFAAAGPPFVESRTTFDE